ncbi:MAG: hypothetical protein VX955_08390, partial [Pseudomonadota bacterium]|nr:hypothetical protein [Pseudomonadota bacterium]
YLFLLVTTTAFTEPIALAIEALRRCDYFLAPAENINYLSAQQASWHMLCLNRYRHDASSATSKRL